MFIHQGEKHGVGAKPQQKAIRKAGEKILAHEMFEYFLNLAFLAVFLVAFAWYRRLLLASYHIEYFGYWTPLIEAAILTKVIMIGDALRVGRRFQNRPLALTAIDRAVVFSVLVILFAFAERIIGAWVHGKPASAGIAEIANKGLDEVLAWCVVMNAAFLPFFAMKEIERAFGAEKIRGMFFSSHAEGTDSPAAVKGDAAKP